ncbi:efflux RND transporter periplasmic adaptor subunit [Ruficoccus amylovorans]|uniref:Efflux RND transporter periplasmic adaptor subunit n=1 Tax=Ruficoccus amylovorans TaxID=1804625 RepID=A0A842HBD0_9BACT|nr:HlyD family secretion protein [Ruficoccus amylovorans]MBC2593378.1 efflux RND transporter periplasmic adaptor subunit [Ruficoccus amylovorans]
MDEKTETGAPAKPKLHPLVAKLLWPLVIIGAAGFAWFGYVEVQKERTRVTTDNAEVKSLVVKIFSPEQGYVTAVQAQENDLVKAGQPLVQLDDNYYQWEVQRAQANFDLAQTKLGTGSQPGLSAAQLQSAEANLQLINAQLKQAQDQFEDAQQAVQDLQAKKDKPGFKQSDLSKALTTSESWQASVNTLEKQSLFAQKQVAEEQANQRLGNYNLDQAKAELEQARLRLANTVIRSPIEGYVAQNNISPGVLLQSNQYLMAVISRSETWITANIKESKIERIQVDYPVIITLDAFPGQTFYGEVESISPAAGSEFALIPRNNASGNFIKTEALIPVRIRVLDPDQKARLLPGMSATVTIMTDPLDKKDKKVAAYFKAKAEIDARAKKQPAAAPAQTTKTTPSPTAKQPDGPTTTDAATSASAPSEGAASPTATPPTTAPHPAAATPAADATVITSPVAPATVPATPSTNTDTPANTAPGVPAPEAPGTGADNQSPGGDTGTPAPADEDASATTAPSAATSATDSQAEKVAERHSRGPVGTDGR